MPRVKRKTVENDSNTLFQCISENQGLTVQNISKKLGWTQSKTNKTLSVLESRGWIVKRIFSAAQPRTATKHDERIQPLRNKFNRLTTWKNKLQAREKELFDECVSAQMEGDSEKAKMYANQCADVRKIIRLVAGTMEALST